MPAEGLPPPIAAVEAEAALLGAMMIENRLIDQIVERVRGEDFFEAAHGRIFDAIVREHNLGRIVTPITLKPYFDTDDALSEVGGGKYLAQLTGSGAQVIGARDFAEQIAEAARRRTLLQRLTEIGTDTRNWDKSYLELVGQAEAAIAEASREADDGTTEMSLAKAMGYALEDEDSVEGVRCGIESIDNALGPISAQELVIIAGRPGMGKTIVGLSYALGVVRARDLSVEPAEVRDGVLFVSREMSAKQLGRRAAADLCFNGHSGINYGDIKSRNLTSEQARTVARAISRVSGLPIEIVDTPRMTVGRLNSTIRRAKRRMAAKGVTLRLVVVDYLQLLEPDQREKDLYTRVTEVSKGLKSAAKANDVALIALAQLSRDVEKRGGNRKPALSDLRDSGQIEQDADGVLFLYRRDYYLKEEEPAEHDPKYPAWKESYEKVQGQIEYIVAKRREQPVTVQRGRFWGAFQTVR